MAPIARENNDGTAEDGTLDTPILAFAGPNCGVSVPDSDMSDLCGSKECFLSS